MKRAGDLLRSSVNSSAAGGKSLSWMIHNASHLRATTLARNYGGHSVERFFDETFIHGLLEGEGVV